MRIWALKNCDTCRKAIKALNAAGFDPEITDVRVDGVSQPDLDRFLAAFGDELVNKRSTTWRGLGETERAIAPIELLMENPTLMKRPVIEAGDGTLYLGWTSAVSSAFE